MLMRNLDPWKTEADLGSSHCAPVALNLEEGLSRARSIFNAEL